MKERELVFITVIGRDQKGIVAEISTYLAEAAINILDISQKITEGYFVMTMLVDIADTRESLEALGSGVHQIGETRGLKIQGQHEASFSMMHRV